MGNHCLLTYRSREEFVDRMEELIREGLGAGETVGFCASVQSLADVEEKLSAAGVDVQGARERRAYIPICVDSLLEELLLNEWPREARFRSFLESIAPESSDRRVRLVGELGALLLGKNQPMVAVALEELLHQARKRYGFDLYCAYPDEAFRNQHPYFHAICAAHSEVVRGADPARSPQSSG